MAKLAVLGLPFSNATSKGGKGRAVKALEGCLCSYGIEHDLHYSRHIAITLCSM